MGLDANEIQDGAYFVRPASYGLTEYRVVSRWPNVNGTTATGVVFFSRYNFPIGKSLYPAFCRPSKFNRIHSRFSSPAMYENLEQFFCCGAEMAGEGSRSRLAQMGRGKTLKSCSRALETYRPAPPLFGARLISVRNRHCSARKESWAIDVSARRV